MQTIFVVECGVKQTPKLVRETIKVYTENEQKKMNEDSLSFFPSSLPLLVATTKK